VICPKCKVGDAHRSHRSGLMEKMASIVAIYPYRCHKCNFRFLKFRYATTEVAVEGPIPHASTQREIRATRSAVEWKRKRRELLMYGAGVVLFAAFLYFITRERGPSSDGN
jgi:hypothetical protein